MEQIWGKSPCAKGDSSYFSAGRRVVTYRGQHLPPNPEYPMTPVEKLQHMEDKLVQRIDALKREGSNVPKHYFLWLMLVADALNQHRRAQV